MRPLGPPAISIAGGFGSFGGWGGLVRKAPPPPRCGPRHDLGGVDGTLADGVYAVCGLPLRPGVYSKYTKVVRWRERWGVAVQAGRKGDSVCGGVGWLVCRMVGL